jgi:hypothetical protein
MDLPFANASQVRLTLRSKWLPSHHHVLVLDPPVDFSLVPAVPFHHGCGICYGLFRARRLTPSCLAPHSNL